MKKGSTLFLKVALLLMGFPILAICVLFVPQLAQYAAELYPDHPYLKYLVMLDLYAAAIPFYFALYQAFKLLLLIDKNEAFTELSVGALRKIKICGIVISALYIVGLPLLYLIAERDDAPGLIVIGMVIAFASVVISVFAAVLEKLLQEAIHIKSENELTV